MQMFAFFYNITVIFFKKPYIFYEMTVIFCKTTVYFFWNKMLSTIALQHQITTNLFFKISLVFDVINLRNKKYNNMKKVIFAVVAFSSLMILSCRQQEEMMDSEDLKSLSVLKEATSKTSKIISDSTIVAKEADITISSLQELDYEKAQPPK